MQQEQITSNELVRKIEDAHDKHVYIMCQNEDYSSTDETDEIEVYADEMIISLRNSEGKEFNIKRSSISRISLSRLFTGGEEINVYMRSSKIDLLLCD